MTFYQKQKVIICAAALFEQFNFVHILFPCISKISRLQLQIYKIYLTLEYTLLNTISNASFHTHFVTNAL